MKKLRILFVILTMVCLAFIWVNSSFDAVESSGISGGFLGLINDFIMGFGINKELSEHFIRKAAHFSEYGVLGFLITMDFKLFDFDIKKCWSNILFWGLMTAVIDETIQLFPKGRSSSVADVWIDFGGICCGLLIAGVIYGFFKNKNVNKNIK